LRTLDVGCGRKKEQGAVGLDRSRLSDADVLAEIESFPWPFADDSFDRVRCSHVIEHVHDVIGFMREIHRVCRKGARVEIYTPYFTSWQSWADPTHVHHFTLRSFDYFIENTPFGFRYTEPLFEIHERRVTFGSSIFDKIAKLLYRFSPTRYERRFSYMFPGRNLIVVMETLK